MENKNKVILEKMIKYTSKILGYTNNITYDEFTSNDMLIEACVFNLGQIGELSNNVDKSFEKEHPEVPWRILYGLRNRIFHDYEGINLLLIWQIITDNLPELLETIVTTYENL